MFHTCLPVGIHTYSHVPMANGIQQYMDYVWRDAICDSRERMEVTYCSTTVYAYSSIYKWVRGLKRMGFPNEEDGVGGGGRDCCFQSDCYLLYLTVILYCILYYVRTPGALYSMWICGVCPIHCDCGSAIPCFAAGRTNTKGSVISLKSSTYLPTYGYTTECKSGPPSKSIRIGRKLFSLSCGGVEDGLQCWR